jgi:Flp pilus assembly protein TadG
VMSLLTCFIRDHRGNVLMLTGVSLVVLFAFGGAGFDLGRQQLMQQKLQQAADAGALAAASMPDGTAAANRESVAQAIFSVNMPERFLGVERPLPTISIGARDVTVSARANMPSTFVGVIGIDTLNTAGSSTVALRSDAVTLDLLLVMDVSASMGENDDAGGAFSRPPANSMRSGCEQGWEKWVVDMGGWPGQCANASLCCDRYEGTRGKNGTTNTRINALRYSAVAMLQQLLQPNPLQHRVALITWSNLLQDTQNFVNTPQPAINFLDQMYGIGATDSSKGMAEAEQRIAAQGRANVTTVVVLMTDGRNGFVPEDPNDQDRVAEAERQRAERDAATRVICSRLRNQPRTLIFTIGFGAEILSDATAQQFLSDCASGEHGPGRPNQNQYYFPVSDGAALNRAFEQIVGTVRRVRILK